MAACPWFGDLTKYLESLLSWLTPSWDTQARSVGLKASSECRKRSSNGGKRRRVDSGEGSDGLRAKNWVVPSPLRRDRRGVEFEGEVWEIWGCRRDLDEVVQQGPKNSQVTRAALQSLQGTSWVNDEVVNFYLSLIQARCNSDASTPELHIFTSYFYSQLVGAKGQYCYENVRRWTRKSSALSKDMIMMPINYKNCHWALILVRLQQGIVELYDSLGKVNANEVFLSIRRWLHDEQNDKRINLGIDKWVLDEVTDAHMQKDFHSCGVYTCIFAERLAAGQCPPFNVSQRDIGRLRLGIAADILACSLE